MNGRAACRITDVLLAALLVAGLSACHRAAPATADVTLTPLPAPAPTLSVQSGRATLRARDVPAGAAWRVACDTATGPVRGEGRSVGGALTQTVILPRSGVYSCAAQVQDAHTSARPGRPTPPLPATRAPTIPVRPAAVAGGTVTVQPATVRIGRREPWTVRAALMDAAGAPVPDGTLVTLSGRGPGGAELLAGRVTVNGEAHWTLLPDTAGPWTLDVQAGPWRARAGGVARSALLGGTPPLLWAGQSLKIGPLTWDDGALPDDGTLVEISALDDRGGAVWSAQAFTVLGRVEVEVPQIKNALTMRLAVAGAAVTVPWGQP